jgi:hypothetical protein
MAAPEQSSPAPPFALFLYEPADHKTNAKQV